MNCLVTININNFLCQNARESFLHAAGRWGCDYLEIQYQSVTTRHPCCEKFNLPQHVGGFDRVMYLDADCVINETAPNPFEIPVEREAFVCVPDFQPQMEPHAKQIEAKYCQLQSRVEELFGIQRIASPSLYDRFNAGMFIYSPGLWTGAFKLCEKKAPADCGQDIEQAIFNAVMPMFDAVRLIGCAWNYMHREPQIPMTAYVQHLFAEGHSNVWKSKWRTE